MLLWHDKHPISYSIASVVLLSLISLLLLAMIQWQARREGGEGGGGEGEHLLFWLVPPNRC